jgi:hypothetical protein
MASVQYHIAWIGRQVAASDRTRGMQWDLNIWIWVEQRLKRRGQVSPVLLRKAVSVLESTALLSSLSELLFHGPSM